MNFLYNIKIHVGVECGVDIAWASLNPCEGELYMKMAHRVFAFQNANIAICKLTTKDHLQNFITMPHQKRVNLFDV